MKLLFSGGHFLLSRSFLRKLKRQRMNIFEIWGLVVFGLGLLYFGWYSGRHPSGWGQDDP
jgi:hypothetical protein